MTEVAWFDLEALSDLVLSAHAGTSGNHESLPHVPGSALLGAVAARLYGRLRRDDAWTVFHSGRVRFGHALPLDGADLALPVPRSWHADKGARSVVEGRFVREVLVNRSHPDASRDGPPLQPVRDGHVSRTGRRLLGARPVHVKSARDPQSRRSADGALFAYEAIPEGSRFVGHLSWDPDVPMPLVTQVLDVLAPEGCRSEDLRVGASRSAQFGRLGITRRPQAPALPGPVSLGRWVQLLLLSDLALEDPDVGPTLLPAPRHFGLPSGRLDASRTFSAHRCYRPFNGRRAASDLARHVLVAGSVLTFELGEEIDSALLASVGARRHGLHTQDGLGHVLANPDWPLGTVSPDFVAATPAAPPPELALPASPLARWAQTRAQERIGAANSTERGKDLAKRLRRLLDQLTHDVPAAIPPSQWAKLVDAARGAGTRQVLDAALRRALTEGVAGQVWSAPLWARGGSTSLAEEIMSSLSDCAVDEAVAVLQRVRDELRRDQ